MVTKQNSKKTSSLVENQPKKVVNLVKKKPVQVGKVYNFKITALGPKNVGMDEFSYKQTVLIPNAQLGEQVKAKVLKIATVPNKAVFAIAKLTEVAVQSGQKKATTPNLPVNTLKPGDKVDVTIKPVRSKSIAIGYTDRNGNIKSPIIVPTYWHRSAPGNVGNLTVKITRLKAKYAMAKPVASTNSIPSLESAGVSHSKVNVGTGKMGQNIVKEGSKFNMTLPKKAKRYLKHIVLKLNGSILFLKLKLGAKLGDKVKVQLVKVFNSINNTTFAVGKVIKVNPISALKKQTMIKHSLRQMLKSGIHFGEKAVKCHARMKKYVWIKQAGQNKNKPLIKKGRNIINLFKTRRCLNKSLNQLAKYAAKGKNFLFVGTKKSLSDLVARASLFSKKSFFVNNRWLGGMLTNWKTMLRAIKKIRPILKEKQAIMSDFIKKRQEIKNHLLQKIVILRKKSKSLIKKGGQIFQKMRNKTQISLLKQHSEKLAIKRTELIQKGQQLLQKRQKLVEKLTVLMLNAENFKQKSVEIANKYKGLLNVLTLNRKKLRELNLLLTLAQQIQQVKQDSKAAKKDVYAVSYVKFQELMAVDGSQQWIIPDPSKQLLTKVVLTMKNSNLGTKNADSSTQSNTINTEKNILVLSRLLNNFSTFIPFLTSSIEVISNNINNIIDKLQKLTQALDMIKAETLKYVDLKNQLIEQLTTINTKLMVERPVLRMLKRKLKKLRAEKRILKSLRKLRFLPTPQTKIANLVPILMQKIVDPKMSFPMETLYNERLSMESKKVAAARKKKWQRLEQYFGGIAHMAKFNKKQISNNVAIIIGQKQEMNAIRECQKLGIKMFHIVDTNCNPTLADHMIPANDDSRNSVKFILTKFLSRIRLAQKVRSRIQNQLKNKKNNQVKDLNSRGRNRSKLKGNTKTRQFK